MSLHARALKTRFRPTWRLDSRARTRTRTRAGVTRKHWHAIALRAASAVFRNPAYGNTGAVPARCKEEEWYCERRHGGVRRSRTTKTDELWIWVKTNVSLVHGSHVGGALGKKTHLSRAFMRLSLYKSDVYSRHTGEHEQAGGCAEILE